ncbi:phage integrase N-terminal SAM-like domain-containing protein [Clostridium sp. CX1]|uniref:phage integrase N-terminal SAM-like domain-containing protein n=1 Tax=Clostridium sp. CX1 TaxID=2978346 RepID=UPI0021C1647B|nr:phage integrase N-terminal SAM-like domain-containing protein [Clostridium sp. CX1]MCT8975011.1 phage integrase N-terminal SAM-like domain-containing protein [Clostridium sp. CX1]
MLEEFKKYLLYKEHKSSSTIETYLRYIQEFINWYNSSTNKELLKLDRKTIGSYKKYLISIKKRKKATVSVELCALVKFNSFFCYKNAPRNYIPSKKHRAVN